MAVSSSTLPLPPKCHFFPKFASQPRTKSTQPSLYTYKADTYLFTHNPPNYTRDCYCSPMLATRQPQFATHHIPSRDCYYALRYLQANPNHKLPISTNGLLPMIPFWLLIVEIDAFEASRGIEKIADLIKDKKVDEGTRLKCGEFLLLLIGHVNVRRDHTPLANIHEDVRQLLGEKCASLIWAASQFGSNLDPDQRLAALHVQARRVLEALEIYHHQ